ncbi:hypothetical protein L7F22_035521 [Adiantum nelumboides]|nr:hypothetical protein [Adiantum nelumboides]
MEDSPMVVDGVWITEDPSSCAKRDGSNAIGEGSKDYSIKAMQCGEAQGVFQLCDPSAIMHIAMTLDLTYIKGFVAAILFVVKHVACPKNIVSISLQWAMRSWELGDIINSTFPYLKLKVNWFDKGLVKDKISTLIRGALEQPLNYARTYVADILSSCVKRVRYVDFDLIVVDDIVKL